MNIREQLLVTHSKENTTIISRYIGRDNTRLKALMDCFFCDEYRVSQRSAMVVSDYFDRHPDLMEVYIEELILNLKKENLHIAVKRNTVRVLQFVDIPEDLISPLFDLCLGYLSALEEPIAVKVFSMQILYNCCKIYPELAQEVIPVLTTVIEFSESKGIQSRGRKIKHLLGRLMSQ